jgi:predicted PurR-regulated permease PerM
LNEGPAVRAVYVAAGLALAAFLAWRLADLLLLVFGAALLATLVRVVADFIRRMTGMPDRAAYAGALLVLLLVVGGFLWLLGAQVTAQVRLLLEHLPGALARLEEWLRGQGWIAPLVEELRGKSAGLATRVGSIALTGADVMVGLLLLFFGAIYFGAEPRLYRNGIVSLFPERARPRAARGLDLGAFAMRRWLLAQLIDMVAVGVLTGAGLYFAGVPSALALGVISGLASFVPFVGPFLAGMLAVLVGFGQSTELALWALGIYLGVQQIENHVIVPAVQRWMIAVPPALALFAIVAMGYLFGPLGVIFAAPLAVVIYVLVKELYVGEPAGP